MSKSLHVVSPLTNRIYAGTVLKDGQTWGANKSDVTGAACGANANKDAALEARIQAAYLSVPEHIRADICEATKWARKTLTDLEGAGHHIYVSSAKDGLVCCHFAKVEWPGDHVGRGMEDGAEAMVMSVCEYMNGA